MENKIKNYLKEQMASFDETKGLILPNWVVIAMYKSGKPNHAVDIAIYDDKKRFDTSMAFFSDEYDLEETYNYMLYLLENEFGFEF